MRCAVQAVPAARCRVLSLRRGSLRRGCTLAVAECREVVGLTRRPRVAQTEKSFQKQPTVFLNAKGASKKKGKSLRYFRQVGLGFKTPKEAIEGKYIDKKCPFTGNVSIRGRILKGVVKTNKMKNTIIVRRDYLHYIKKYNRFEKRHKNVAAHASPAFRINEGDNVVIGECRSGSRPLPASVALCLECASSRWWLVLGRAVLLWLRRWRRR
jgi:small subunit ribosomal protein S11e